FQLKVKKYSAETGEWSTIGDPINSTDTLNLRTFSIAVDVYGDPLLLYTNELHQPTVAHFDSDINNWGATNLLEAVDGDDLIIKVGPNGVAYAAFVVEKELYVYKFDSPDNN